MHNAQVIISFRCIVFAIEWEQHDDNCYAQINIDEKITKLANPFENINKQ